MIYPINHKNLEIKSEEEADADEKGPYILPSKSGKAVKEMRDKATGDNGVTGDVLQLLQGFHRSYNDCLKGGARSYKMQ
jgi:hypothetical protein